jgi:sRNA-binding regulator protein Hfq
MAYLSGLQEYLQEHYFISVYDQALQSGEMYTFHAHGQQIFQGKVIKNDTFDLEIAAAAKQLQRLPKTNIKLIYPSVLQQDIQKQIKIDPQISQKKIPPLVHAKERYHVKNKSLFPLMEERQVLFFYMLEGEVLKGILADFSRYEMTVHLKGALPVTIFRHALLNLTDKKKRSYLKSFQEKAKDWQKSQLYITEVS